MLCLAKRIILAYKPTFDRIKTISKQSSNIQSSSPSRPVILCNASWISVFHVAQLSIIFCVMVGSNGMADKGTHIMSNEIETIGDEEAVGGEADGRTGTIGYRWLK